MGDDLILFFCRSLVPCPGNFSRGRAEGEWTESGPETGELRVTRLVDRAACRTADREGEHRVGRQSLTSAQQLSYCTLFVAAQHPILTANQQGKHPPRSIVLPSRSSPHRYRWLPSLAERVHGSEKKQRESDAAAQAFSLHRHLRPLSGHPTAAHSCSPSLADRAQQRSRRRRLDRDVDSCCSDYRRSLPLYLRDPRRRERSRHHEDLSTGPGPVLVYGPSVQDARRRARPARRSLAR